MYIYMCVYKPIHSVGRDLYMGLKEQDDNLVPVEVS